MKYILEKGLIVMFIANLNVETKTLRIISLVITLIGMIFILASNYVGNLAIRIAMIVIFILCLFNFKMSYPFSSTVEKINMIFGILGTVLVFIKPHLTMFIIGVALLVLAVPTLYKAVKNKDYSDKIMLIISGIGTLFSIYSILNGGAALNTVIIIIGIAFVIIGCLILFETFDINRKSNKFAKYEREDTIDEEDEHRFENTEEL